MKKLGIILMLVLVINTVYGQEKTQTVTFKVAGNCGMCKQRIENACYLKGVKTANWDVAEQMLTVTYRTDKIELETISEKVAAAGHDTEFIQTTDELYNNLHGCCQYKRIEQ